MRSLRVQQVAILRLTPHPANRMIYGPQEDVSDLADSIREHGVKEPLAITRSYIIISGHRRWLAAKSIGLTRVPVVFVKDFKTPQDEIAALLTYNQQRAKTHEQRVREGLKWFEIESANAKARQHTGKRANLVANLPQGSPGKTRDKVAALAGIGGGRNFDKGRAAIDLIDRLTSEGKRLEAEGLRRELNRSYNAGFLAIKRHAKDPSRTLALLSLVGEDAAKDLHNAQEVAILQQRNRIPHNLPAHTDRYDLYHGDLLKVGHQIQKRLGASREITIITDPPYTSAPYGDGHGDDFRDAYHKLADFAAEYLPAGGSLFTTAGTYHLPEILDLLRGRKELSYYWTLCVHQPGPSARQQWRLVNTNWKPILWFVKGKPADHRGKKINDVIKSEWGRKTEHRWQQPHAPYEFLINNMTTPGDIVIDPFMGTGTTGVVSLELGRRFVGIEIQEGVYRQAAKQMKDTAARLDART